MLLLKNAQEQWAYPIKVKQIATAYYITNSSQKAQQKRERKMLLEIFELAWLTRLKACPHQWQKVVTVFYNIKLLQSFLDSHKDSSSNSDRLLDNIHFNVVYFHPRQKIKNCIKSSLKLCNKSQGTTGGIIHYHDHFFFLFRHGRTSGTCHTMKCDFMNGQLRNLESYFEIAENFVTTIYNSVVGSLPLGK